MYAQLSLIISLHLFILLKYHAHSQLDYEKYYLDCNKTFDCGQNVKGIGYPFWGGERPEYCGLQELELSCESTDVTMLDMDSDTKFHVLNINMSTYEITMERVREGDDDTCIPPKFLNSTAKFIETQFVYGLNYGQGSGDLYLFYGCPLQLQSMPVVKLIRNNFTYCESQGNIKNVGFFGNETLLSILHDCKNKVRVPVNRTVLKEFGKNKTMELRDLLRPSFVVYYRINEAACSACMSSGGLCRSGTSSTDPPCLCRDGAYHSVCPKHKGHKRNMAVKNVVIGLGSAAFGIGLAVLAFCIYNRRKKAKNGSSLISRNISSYPSSMSDSEKGGTFRGVTIFSYNELEKATNNFDSNTEVGDGGFGTVYKGKLQDGRVVAVKRLYENNFRRVEQFMNEIEILTRLRHPNLVSLYGCTSQHCRQLLLVYEYIPNGTIADHLHGEGAKPGSPSWKTRLSIAIETATALAYLHVSDVIHRDVKTTNILLDDNFSVKVADFGLSRLFPFNVTHVSTAPQGTPGYVDPEYHECYHLTDKSDVYSFGVVLIELISSKPAVDITRHRHEINLSNMAINKIQNDALHELVDPNLGFESDYEVRKMIGEVAELAFQCLQNERDLRPSMEEVLKKLKGIQSKYYGTKNQVEVDLLDDDALLLKNNPQILSPDSVTVKWVSSSEASSYS